MSIADLTAVLGVLGMVVGIYLTYRASKATKQAAGHAAMRKACDDKHETLDDKIDEMEEKLEGIVKNYLERFEKVIQKIDDLGKAMNERHNEVMNLMLSMVKDMKLRG